MLFFGIAPFPCTYLLLELLLDVEYRNIKNTFLLTSKIQKHKDRGEIFHDFQSQLNVDPRTTLYHFYTDDLIAQLSMDQILGCQIS